MSEEPRWLNADQQKVWRTYLLGSAQLLERMDADLRRYGMDLPEYEILVALEEAPEKKMRMSELAVAAHQSRSRLTHTISRMEKAGMVIRTTNSIDRRGVWAQLTDAGFKVLDGAAPDHVNAVRRNFVDVIDPLDYEAVGRAFAAVIAAGS